MCQHTIDQLLITLSTCINKRNIDKLHLYLSNLETEWSKVSKYPQEYAEYLDRINEDYRLNENNASKAFFQTIEYPIHPQFVLDRLVEASLKRNNFKMTLLHKAIQAVRASEKQSKVTLAIVDCLLKVKYPVYPVDHEQNMAINTFFSDSPTINEAALTRILEQ